MGVYVRAAAGAARIKIKAQQAEKGGHLAHAHTSHALRWEAQLYGRIGRKGERAGRPITKGPLARRPPNTPDAHLCATPSNTADDARIGVRVLFCCGFQFLAAGLAARKHKTLTHTQNTHTHAAHKMAAGCGVLRRSSSV